jgi:broad specificity phosphatase PhoE
VRVTLVRHGRAAAGWNVDPDPGLDDLGRSQADAMAAHLAPSGPLALVTSPLRRCRETAVPLASAWSATPVVDERVREIPSPEGYAMEDRVEWLRAAMGGTWADLGPRFTGYRDAVVAAVAACPVDTVIVSHFIAINAVIGACVGDDRLVIASLDNCSRTVVEIAPDGSLRLVEQGHEADTLIR